MQHPHDVEDDVVECRSGDDDDDDDDDDVMMM